MKRQKLALCVVDLAFAIAEKVAYWLEAAEKRKRLPRPLTVADLLEIRTQKDAARRSQAPTVVIPPPSEWAATKTGQHRKPGGGSSRY